jgi:hypothetical protein
MENADANRCGSIPHRKSITRGRTSITRPGGRRSSIRRSLNSRLLDSGESPLSQDSDDQEWLRIQQRVQAAALVRSDMDGEVEELFTGDEECVCAITFDSAHGANLGQQHEVALLRRSMELDEETQYIDDYVSSMEGNFALMFAEITLRRMNAERVVKRNIDLYDLIDSLNLPDYPQSQWGERLEAAIFIAMRSAQ